ncbi:DUF4192 domain-containing protein [Nocardioides ferulae]|uniref:DUF4192 domain-containing protein n=1 Tax=Nocardioides ferulae TaxID=2340821 RepID=UPI000EAFFFFB|nr:DUF4192 domain-containing protein [Nocardioides ferulae]
MTTTPSDSQPRRTLTARSPEDLLAAVPVLLGFHPTESAVMITLGAAGSSPGPFHARCDLPDPAPDPTDASALDELAETLLRPVRRHRVTRVAFVLYTADGRLGDRVAGALQRHFGRAGVGVLPVLRADGSRWWTCPAGGHGSPRHGVPYDVSSHPFLVESVVLGRVTHGSRTELADMVAAVPELVAAVDDALAEIERQSSALDAGRRLDGQLARLARAAALARGERPLGSVPDIAETAALLDALTEESARDLLLRSIDRESASEHVTLWTTVLRRAPQRALAGPALLLAWSAWQAGDGALAWCALDRGAEAGAETGESDPMAALLERMLAEAVPPSAVADLWAGLDEIELLEEEAWRAAEQGCELDR